MTIILAIDPAPETSAFVKWDGLSILDFGMFKNIEQPDIKPDLLPDILVIEKIESYGMAVGASVFETCIWIGRFIEKWLHGKCKEKPWVLLPRREVKLHLCGSARAKDSNVRTAILDRFGGKKKAIGNKLNPGLLYGVKNDEWQALALALTWWDTHENM